MAPSKASKKAKPKDGDSDYDEDDAPSNEDFNALKQQNEEMKLMFASMQEGWITMKEQAAAAADTAATAATEALVIMAAAKAATEAAENLTAANTASTTALIPPPEELVRITGYKRNAPLTKEQVAFKELLQDFNVNEETAEEMMRSGIDSIKRIKQQIINGDELRCLKSLVIGFNKNKTPTCPDPKKVYAGPVLTAKLYTLSA